MPAAVTTLDPAIVGTEPAAGSNERRDRRRTGVVDRDHRVDRFGEPPDPVDHGCRVVAARPPLVVPPGDDQCGSLGGQCAVVRPRIGRGAGDETRRSAQCPLPARRPVSVRWSCDRLDEFCECGGCLHLGKMADARDHVDRAVQQFRGPPCRVVAHGRRPLADGDHDPHRTIGRDGTRLEAGESGHLARDQCRIGPRPRRGPRDRASAIRRDRRVRSCTRGRDRVVHQHRIVHQHRTAHRHRLARRVGRRRGGPHRAGSWRGARGRPSRRAVRAGRPRRCRRAVGVAAITPSVAPPLTPTQAAGRRSPVDATCGSTSSMRWSIPSMTRSTWASRSMACSPRPYPGRTTP